jgi:hypothetical protein
MMTYNYLSSPLSLLLLPQNSSFLLSFAKTMMALHKVLEFALIIQSLFLKRMRDSSSQIHFLLQVSHLALS